MDIATGLIAIGAGIAVGTAGIGTAIGQGSAVAAALTGIARNPEMTGAIRTNMFVGCALIESSVIYGLIISILLVFKM
ncbi:MAG: ATP synthase F0 subunit C [Mycoplasmatales bacterium]